MRMCHMQLHKKTNTEAHMANSLVQRLVQRLAENAKQTMRNAA